MLRHVPTQAMNAIKKYVRGVPASVPYLFPLSKIPAVNNPEFPSAFYRHNSIFSSPSTANPALPAKLPTSGQLIPYSPNAGALVPFTALSQSPMLPDFHPHHAPSLHSGELADTAVRNALLEQSALPFPLHERPGSSKVNSSVTDLASVKSLISPESLLMPAGPITDNRQSKTKESYTDQTEWIKSLKKEEIRAIRIYTGDSYMAINQFLRGQIDELPKDLPPDIITNINNAINKMFIPEPITVFRGTDIFEDINRYFTYNTNKELKSVKGLIGQTIVEKAFLSTSTREDCSFNDLKTHWTIEVSAGSHGGLIAPISAVPSESEMLFSTNKQLLIVNAEIVGKFVNIHAKMV